MQQTKKTKYPKINFRIIEVSSQEKDYPASFLLSQSPESKGWQSARYCPYPQYIIIELQDFCKLRQITVLSHQHKIATKVELHFKTNSEFKKLGHFSISSNEDTSFKARELKNIPVSVNCKILKFTFQNNHINKLNIFNQVGIISICLYGEKIVIETQKNLPPKQDESIKQIEQISGGQQKKIIELETLKKQAVDNQDYEKAKQYKQQIQNLKKLGGILTELEQKKKKAVEEQDYDQAKKIQQQIKSIKQGKNIITDVIVQKLNTQKIDEQQSKGFPPNLNKKSNDKEKQPQYVNKSIIIQKKNQLKHDQIPINPKQNNLEEFKDEEEQNPKELSNPQPLKGEILKLIDPHTDIISESIFQQIFSKNYQLREAGIQQLKNLVGENLKKQKNRIINSVLFAIKYLIDDKIATIIISTLELFSMLLKKYKSNGVIDNAGNLQYILSKLADYQGHINEKVRNASIQFFADLPRNLLTNKELCFKSLTQLQNKKVYSPKIIMGRLSMIKTIIEIFKIGKNPQQIIQFNVKYLDDKNNDVRNASMQLIKLLIEELGYTTITPYLKDIRAPIIKSIQSMIDKDEQQHNIKEKQSEQEMVTAKINVQQNKKQSTQIQNQKSFNNKPSQIEEQSATVNNKNMDHYCDYCDKYDLQFEDENFRDIHLFNTCPMLTLCECKQAVQVSTLTYHRLSECQNKYFKKCARCKQAIHQRKYKAHTESRQCLPAKPLSAANRCPLCHEDIQTGVQGWRNHLVIQKCPQHNR